MKNIYYIILFFVYSLPLHANDAIGSCDHFNFNESHMASMREQAQEGDVDFQHILKQIPDKSQASDLQNHIRLWCKQAQSGNAEAQLNVALLWDNFTLPDHFKYNGDTIAEYWYLKAAKQNNARAHRGLANFYAMRFKLDKALKWALSASKLGDTVSRFNAARIYFHMEKYVESYAWTQYAMETSDSKDNILVPDFPAS
jgi:TPR repeat protein